MLVKYVNSQNKDSWHLYLDTCVFSYNTSRHESTKHTPFELMFNRKATLPIDVNLRERSIDEIAGDYEEFDEPDLEQITDKRNKLLSEAKTNIMIAQQKQKIAYDKKHAKPELFAAGQLVLKKDFRRRKRKGGKLDFRYVGPFEIKRKLGNGVFELANCNGGDERIRVTGAHLKPYHKGNESPNNLVSCALISYS